MGALEPPGYNYDVWVLSEDLQVVNQEKTTNYYPRRDHVNYQQNRNYGQVVGGGG